MAIQEATIEMWKMHSAVEKTLNLHQRLDSGKQQTGVWNCTCGTLMTNQQERFVRHQGDEVMKTVKEQLALGIR